MYFCSPAEVSAFSCWIVKNEWNWRKEEIIRSKIEIYESKRSWTKTRKNKHFTLHKKSVKKEKNSQAEKVKQLNEGWMYNGQT